MREQKIIFLLFPKAHLLDLSGPAQVFYEASKLGGKQRQIIFAAQQPKVLTAQGAHFAGLVPISDLHLQARDFICVPGIDFEAFVNGHLDDAAEGIGEWMKEHAKKGVFIGSICSGALLLAKMGLLNGRQCTSHWKCIGHMKENFRKTKIIENRLYCFDKNIFTSAGMTAGIDMCLALIEKWDSPLVAARVAQEMVINIRRPESVSQRNIFLDFQNHFNADVYRAQEILASELRSNFTVVALAKQLNMSPRHLARIFKSHTGGTIQDYRDTVRMKRGKQLLLHSKKSIKEVAIECGFENTRQFLRLWNKYHRSTPSEFRRINREDAAKIIE